MTVGSEVELLTEAPPLRLSGPIALVLGLLSFTALLGTPMVIVPILAVVAALVALRPYAGPRPTGYRVAFVGLFFAVLFGVWGFTSLRLKHRMLSHQAHAFAATWLDLLAQGDIEMALELKKHRQQRQPPSMPLREYYRTSAEGRATVEQFRENDATLQVIDAGTAVQWAPFRASESYQFGGRQLTSTYWKDQSGTVNTPILVSLEYIPATADAPAQWLVDNLSAWIVRPGES